MRAPHARGLFTPTARVQARQGACKARTLRDLRFKAPVARSRPARRPALIVANSAFCTLHSALCALRTLNSFSRLALRPRVSPGFRFPGLPASGGFPARDSRLCPSARVSPGFLFPVPRSPFPAFGSYPQRRMPIRPCKNHQIRVKIDQKGDVFRQKGIKKARISSCPS